MKNTTNRSAHRKATADKKSLPFAQFNDAYAELVAEAVRENEEIRKEMDKHLSKKGLTYYLRYEGSYVEGFIPMFAYDDPLDDGYPYYELSLTHKRSEALVVSKEFADDVKKHFGGDVQAVCTRRFAIC